MLSSEGWCCQRGVINIPPPVFNKSGPRFSRLSVYGYSVNIAPPSAHLDRLLGQVVKAPASRAEDLGFDSRFSREDFHGSSHISDLKIGTPVAALPGDIGLALGLVGPVSVYCDEVR